MGNNNTKTDQTTSNSRTAGGNKPIRPNVVYIQTPPRQDIGVNRVNNLPTNHQQNIPHNLPQQRNELHISATGVNNLPINHQPNVPHNLPQQDNGLHISATGVSNLPVNHQSNVHLNFPGQDSEVQFSADRVNNRQLNFPHGSPLSHTSGNGIFHNRIYPHLPSAPTEPSNRRQLLINNVPGNNLPAKRELPTKVSEVQEKTKPIMDTSELLELSNKESSNIIRYLMGKKKLFENTVQGSLSHSVLEVLMKIVRKICFADSYTEKIELLTVVCCDNFLNTLGIYILNVPTHQKDCAREDVLFLEGNVLPFFETILLLIPNLVCSKLRDLLIQTNLALNGLQQYHDIKVDDATRMKLKKLESGVKRHLNPEAPDITNEEEGTSAKDLKPDVKEKNAKSGPSHSAHAQAKHLDFLSRNVFPDVISKLDVPAHRVLGMSRNIYFVDNIKNNGEGTVEGSFLLALANYLVRQKYKPNNILLLTTSDEDMKHIVDIKDKSESLKDLPVGLISSVDKFDAIIILISCPVSKTDVQNIYCERQLCKALLGAKNGVYMVGNLSLLEKVSPFWKEMKRLLQQHEAVSSELPIFCEPHQMLIRVSQVNDLKKLKNGACSNRCGKKLKCGHFCKRLCHFDDRQHKHYKCSEPCSRKPKKCSMNHTCNKLCHEPCGFCTMQLENNNKISLCHELFIHQKKGENTSLSQTSKGQENTSLLPCGHSDPRLGIIDRQLDLWSPELASLCQMPCSVSLECGHVCSGTCGRCRQGRVHLPCRNQGKRTLACGHRFVSVCSSNVQQCEQKCFYECPHGRCKEKCGVPCTPCKEMCTIGCEHSKCTKRCFELCDRQPCLAPCKELLACGHQCIGMCGEPCPPGPENCRVCSAEKMKRKDSTGRTRFVLLSNCNHVVRINDLDRKAFSKVRKLENLACPLCGYNITKTTRYLNYAKELHRNLVVVRHVHKMYNDNLTTEFWNIAKEIRSLSLPKEIENHPKLEEIKKQFQSVQETKVAEHKQIILLKFLRNLLYPIVDGCSGLASSQHLDWLLILLLERYEMGICSQVLRELYKEIIEFQKLKGRVYQNHILDLHKAIGFFTYLEKNTWMKCAKGHLSTYRSLLTECGTCDGIKH